MLHQLVGQCKVPDILHVLHIVEGDALQVHVGYFIDVLLVLLTHHDVSNAGTLGSQNLLLDATYGQHLSTERDFTGHGGILANLALGQCRGD